MYPAAIVPPPPSATASSWIQRGLADRRVQVATLLFLVCATPVVQYTVYSFITRQIITPLCTALLHGRSMPLIGRLALNILCWNRCARITYKPYQFVFDTLLAERIQTLAHSSSEEQWAETSVQIQRLQALPNVYTGVSSLLWCRALRMGFFYDTVYIISTLIHLISKLFWQAYRLPIDVLHAPLRARITDLPSQQKAALIWTALSLQSIASDPFSLFYPKTALAIANGMQELSLLKRHLGDDYNAALLTTQPLRASHHIGFWCALVTDLGKQRLHCVSALREQFATCWTWNREGNLPNLLEQMFVDMNVPQESEDEYRSWLLEHVVILVQKLDLSTPAQYARWEQQLASNPNAQTQWQIKEELMGLLLPYPSVPSQEQMGETLLPQTPFSS